MHNPPSVFILVGSLRSFRNVSRIFIGVGTKEKIGGSTNVKKNITSPEENMKIFFRPSTGLRGGAIPAPPPRIRLMSSLFIYSF